MWLFTTPASGENVFEWKKNKNIILIIKIKIKNTNDCPYHTGAYKNTSIESNRKKWYT